MATGFSCISPVDGSVVFDRPYATDALVYATLTKAYRAFREWSRIPLPERIAACHALLDRIQAKADPLAHELTMQMGRPIRYSPGELQGFDLRGRTMLDLAAGALAPIQLPDDGSARRRIHKEPLGVVLVLAPWNYPWLTAVNVLIPALVAGNTVVLKHAEQTALVAEALQQAALDAGIPEGVLQSLHMTHEMTAKVVEDPRIAHVAFTGSVAGGIAVHTAAAGTFKTVGLELGGNDAAYVHPSADPVATADALVDGSMFNSGQSCCAVERIFVHESVAKTFLERFVATTRDYVLGDPTDPDTTLGPIVRHANAAGIRGQVERALAAGARGLLDPASFQGSARGLPYLAPQILVDVDDDMQVMAEETFGPVAAIAVVRSDDEAIERMNGTRYGLTASVWGDDLDAAEALVPRLEAGTVYVNRCDYLDPMLPWVGIKDSGRGHTLSALGYDRLTRPKSVYVRPLPKES